MGAPLAITFAILLFTFQNYVIEIFTKDPAVIKCMQDSFFIASISLVFDFFQQLQLGIVRGIGLYKQASVCNVVGYELVLMPLVTILIVWVEIKSTVVLWTSLLCAYAMVNTCYFILIWGIDLKGQKFYKGRVIKCESKVEMTEKLVIEEFLSIEIKNN